MRAARRENISPVRDSYLWLRRIASDRLTRADEREIHAVLNTIQHADKCRRKSGSAMSSKNADGERLQHLQSMTATRSSPFFPLAERLSSTPVLSLSSVSRSRHDQKMPRRYAQAVSGDS